VRQAHISPFFGLPGFPETIYDVLTISFNVHLRVNGQILDTKRATVGLGDTTMVKLAGTAPSAGIYDVKIDPTPVANGDVAPLGKRDGTIGVGDALIALRFALGLETPTQEDIHHGDVAPLDASGQPGPDGVIDVGDALVILRKALGIIWF
jgi:hypothetical protein